MKRYLLSLLLVFFSFVGMAQKAEDHMTFMGIPMTESLESFSLKLQEQGFKYLQKNEKGDILTFQGTFAGYSDCILSICQAKQEDKVESIVLGVAYSRSNSWKNLSDRYYHIKELLVKEYGVPDYVREGFESITLKEDTARMEALYAQKCKYETSFVLPQGWITLSIGHDEKSFKENFSYVGLIYTNLVMEKLRERSKNN